MLPLGATVNMDGSVMYGAIVTIFIAQLNDIALSPGRVAVIWYVAGVLSCLLLQTNDSEIVANLLHL